jgi:hypothetical protein
MKRSFALALLGLGLGTAACASAPPPAPKAPLGGAFHALLAPHGSWDEIPGLGVVWCPSVSAVGIGFVPYASSGRWVWSDDGWMFASDFDWGWAPFHYGRWLHHSTYGWIWTPGSSWGPAWVDWRYGHGFIAWAPTPPLKDTGHPRWLVTETRSFVERDLVANAVSETPAITAAVDRSHAPKEESATPSKEWVAASTGRPVPELSAIEVRRAALTKVSLREPAAMGHLVAHTLPRAAPAAPKPAPPPAPPPPPVAPELAQAEIAPAPSAEPRQRSASHEAQSHKTKKKKKAARPRSK